MKTTVLFEVNTDYIMAPDTAIIYDSFRYLNWYHNKDTYDLKFSSLKDNGIYDTIPNLIEGIQTEDTDIQGIIPIGSIEFVERYLGKDIQAINIPKELMVDVYTKREIVTGGEKELGEMLSRHPKVFIKDALHCKKYEPIIISNKTGYKLPKHMLISEVIDIESEWRTFVFRGKILDCRQYLGDFKDRPDYNLIEQAVKDWKNCPTAYTLDIGKTKSGETVLIEAHNFISCGLYGFEQLNKLALMSIIAYKEEHNSKRDGGLT